MTSANTLTGAIFKEAPNPTAGLGSAPSDFQEMAQRQAAAIAQDEMRRLITMQSELTAEFGTFKKKLEEKDI